MRSTLISLIVVLVLAAGLCAFSQALVVEATQELDTLRLQALAHVRAADAQAAEATLARFERRWEDVAPSLETVASHDALHQVSSELADARACIETGDLDDCLRALVQLERALDHIRVTEELSFSNLY